MALAIEHCPGVAIAQFDPGTRYSPPTGSFWSVTETPEETTIVCP